MELLVRRNDRLALLGDNGSGKTTLLRIIRGELAPDEGIVKIGSSIKAGYLPQHVVFDNPEMSVLETVRHELIMIRNHPDPRRAHVRDEDAQDGGFFWESKLALLFSCSRMSTS